MLKTLREKKNVSRMQLSKLTQLSTYQVEGLEGKGAANLLSRIFICVKALGYKAEDIVNLMDHHTQHAEIKFPRGIIGKPLSETNYSDGVKIYNYHQEPGSQLVLLEMAVGKSLARGLFPMGDIVFVIVREGVLVVDSIINESVYKKDHFLILPGGLPVEFINGHNCLPVSAILFSVKFPR